MSMQEVAADMFVTHALLLGKMLMHPSILLQSWMELYKGRFMTVAGCLYVFTGLVCLSFLVSILLLDRQKL